MNIILIDPKTGHTRSIPLRGGLVAAVVLGFLMIGGLAGWGGHALIAPVEKVPTTLTEDLKADVQRNSEIILAAKKEAEDRLTALTMRLAELQAKIVRLDALGERLVDVAKLHDGEFDFSTDSPVGGPHEGDLEDAIEKPSLLLLIESLASDIQRREEQLEILESLLESRKLQSDVYLAGRPVRWGWMSSRFGRRNDPFTGKLAWHHGVDFAGKEGSDIVSVGSGVVTWAGERHGYGLLVEVNHGKGYSTRYAHAKELLVGVGEIVRKGQTVALMGSTGRSTGPHVHFEVLRNSKAVDPSRYINRRASR